MIHVQNSGISRQRDQTFYRGVQMITEIFLILILVAICGRLGIIPPGPIRGRPKKGVTRHPAGGKRPSADEVQRVECRGPRPSGVIVAQLDNRPPPPIPRPEKAKAIEEEAGHDG